MITYCFYISIFIHGLRFLFVRLRDGDDGMRDRDLDRDRDREGIGYPPFWVFFRCVFLLCFIEYGLVICIYYSHIL